VVEEVVLKALAGLLELPIQEVAVVDQVDILLVGLAVRVSL
jgi:hypothetical protein